MNRIGLASTLAAAIVVGLVFGLYPQLDLKVTAPFYDRDANLFAINAQPWVQHARDAARWIVGLAAAPAVFALIGKLILPHRRMLIAGRAALLVVTTLALGPGLLTNVILKDHWGRSRPIDVTQFGGIERFTPWWDPRGNCPSNCSFVAGEPSAAFWTLAPAVLAPPQWRLVAYGAAVAFGILVGLLRIAAGAHFFTDVVFAGVFTFVLIWIVHGVVYRWAPTRMRDDAIERPLAQAGEAIRRLFGA